MIAERIQQSYTSAKYYQFYSVATILEHVIDCFHTIVSDETNPYHPPLSWLTRKQLKPPGDELFLDLIEECSTPRSGNSQNQADGQLSSGLRLRLEKCPEKLRKDIISRTRDGSSPLFLASMFGHSGIVKYLLESCEADIEQKGRYEAPEDHHVHSVSPLWVAAVSGNLDAVKLLIENGANVNSLSDTGSTPLRSVCFLCKDDDSGVQHIENEIGNDDSFSYESDSREDIYMDIVRLLVDNGAEVSKPNFNGGTCLINSIHNCNLTRYLIENGADVNASDHQSKTALHYAIQQGLLDITKLLLSSGADPMLNANFSDDALQLCCLGGHLDIFNHLIANIEYPRGRLSDAYKLLGSSIVELHDDLSIVSSLWHKSLKFKLQSDGCENDCNNVASTESRDVEALCDIRRTLAYGDIVEFDSEQELQSLSEDEYRIQSLIISERILGADHRETVQRILYRGTFYINSLRPDRCVNLWIYALQLKLRHNSIFHFESIFAAQAITKLILDLVSQHQQVEFRNIQDVLWLLVDQLNGCEQHLKIRPISCLHEDIFDLLLGIIANLLVALICTAYNTQESQTVHKLVKKIIQINPQTSNGSSLLHVCIAPGIFDGEAHKLVNPVRFVSSSLVELVTVLIDHGLEVDPVNNNGLSPLQALCLSSIRVADKRNIIKILVERGAHVDRRSATLEQGEIIRQALVDASVNPFDHVTLSCLAARKVAELKIKFDEKLLAKRLRHSIAMH